MDGHKAGKRDIELFSGYYLSTAEACALIRAYSGADVIREWQGISSDLAAQDAGERAEAMSTEREATGAWYAGVRTRKGGRRHGAGKTVFGQGQTPDRALADLIWRLVGPRLLTDDCF